MSTDPARQQPCSHCGDCVRACPEALDPRGLFFALVEEDWTRVAALRLDACTDCNRCTDTCPSHIPLAEWLHWGKASLRARRRADAARERHLARNARLAREREARGRRRGVEDAPSAAAARAATITREEVLAAIARGRARRRGAAAKDADPREP